MVSRRPRRSAAAALADVAAVASAAVIWRPHLGAWALPMLVAAVVAHLGLLTARLVRLVRSGECDRRIDGILAVALACILWFGMVPPAAFLR